MSSDKPPPADTLQLPGRSIAARIDRLDIIYDIFRDACEEFRWELHCFPFTYFHTPTRRVNFRTIFCACRTKIEANSLLPARWHKAGNVRRTTQGYSGPCGCLHVR